MEKTILTIICFCVVLCMAAQEKTKFIPHQEIRVSIGAIPMLPELNFKWKGYIDGCSPMPDLQTVYSLKTVHQPAVNLSYTYWFKKWFALEMRISYSGSYEKYYDLYTDQHLFSDKSSHLSFLPIARFHWVNTSMVSLYSSVGIGIMFSKQKNKDGWQGEHQSQVFPAVHFSPIGISVGRKLFGFAELGASMVGVFQAGMGYKF